MAAPRSVERTLHPTTHPTPTPDQVATEEPDAKDFDPRRQFVVIIRHGKTENNKLGIFTGWEAVDLYPLTPDP